MENKDLQTEEWIEKEAEALKNAMEELSSGGESKPEADVFAVDPERSEDLSEAAEKIAEELNWANDQEETHEAKKETPAEPVIFEEKKPEPKVKPEPEVRVEKQPEVKSEPEIKKVEIKPEPAVKKVTEPEIRVEKRPEVKKEPEIRVEKEPEIKIEPEQVNYTVMPGRLPLSLSVESACGLAVKIAEIGDSLPIKRVKVFSTGMDIPDAVGIRLYAGERPFAADNMFLTELKVDGIKKLPYGRPVISLIVDVDMDCNINVSVTDEGSLNSDSAVISREWVPSSDKIFQMVRTAQENQKSDGIRQNKEKLLQMAKESLCRCEFKYRAIKKKLSADKAISYRRRINNLRSKLKKVKANEMTELEEKSIIASI
ncbi:MAG TPA: Hsp70 family protein, partial [Candidatus Alectryocaccobium stercorigallinarum]|nr:Hsp70 family protein [Candidatus Alectryocaccobium stercorigallinarum]